MPGGARGGGVGRMAPGQRQGFGGQWSSSLCPCLTVLWGSAESLWLGPWLRPPGRFRAPSSLSGAQLESLPLTWGKHHPALAWIQGPNISIMKTWSSPAHSSLNDQAVKRGCLWGKRWAACRRERRWGLSRVNEQTGLFCRLRTKPPAGGKYV